MAENVKGEDAIGILRKQEIHNCFTDADNPVSLQVIYRLSEWFLNSGDIRKIENADRSNGPIAAGAEFLECLIKSYKDQPEKLTLADFIEALENQNTNAKLVNMLYSAVNNTSNYITKMLDSNVITDIKARLQFMCENVAKVWGKLLNETSLEKCFVEPEIVEEEMGEDGKRRRKETGKTINNYVQLFQSESFGDRIVIEGNPGMGKTTYVNKLALDWTWDKGKERYSQSSSYLQLMFSVVFLIPLRHLNGRKSTTFAQAADIQLKKCGTWLSAQFQENPAKCLLILDAFDEYDGSCSEINEIIEGTLFPRLKVIITTRPSHIERLKTKNQWLSITGLTTPEKRERFLANQGWRKVEERDMIIHILSGLGTLWHTPLYLAMLCVLYKASKVTNFDPSHPNCFYVLVKLFTEHMMSRCVTEKGFDLKKNEKQKLKSYIQQQAFQQFAENNPWLAKATHMKGTAATSMHRNSTFNNLKLNVQRFLPQAIRNYTRAPPIQLPDSQYLMNMAGQFGLVTIREERSPDTGETTEVALFVHQMFVEYYAAMLCRRLILNVVTCSFVRSPPVVTYPFVIATCQEHVYRIFL